MPSLKRGTHLASALIFVTAALFAASEPWDGPAFSADPKALLAAAEAVSSGESDVVVLLDETRYEFDASGRSVSTHKLVFRIVGESALEDWATVEARWTPWLEERPAIDARVVTKDGLEHRLDQHAVVETPGADNSADMFTDDRLLKAPLPAAAPGSVIEQIITHRETKSPFEAGTTGLARFGSYVPTQRIRLTIDAPSSLDIRLANETQPRLEPVRQVSGERQTIRFEGGPYEAVEHFEWNLPYDLSPVPYVAFSTGKSWQEVAAQYAAVVNKQIALTPADKLPHELLEKAEPKQLISRALAYIQTRIRYAGVELSESSIVPRTPSAVISTRYGDCKDKATLLVAILRAAGIPADLALVRSGTDLDIRKDLPGFGRFNHAIVRVGGAEPMWIDPTAEFFRAGELPPADQGRLTLVASTETTDLTLTPVVEGKENWTIETRTFTLSEEGKATVVEQTEAGGDAEASMRSYAAGTEKKSYRDSLEAYVKGHYLASGLKNLDVNDPHDLRTPFRLRLEISEAGRGVTEGGQAIVALFPSNLARDLPYALLDAPDPDDEKAVKDGKRNNDFVFTPYVKEWRYRIVPPPGFDSANLPKNETVTLGTTTLVESFVANSDGTVTATFHFDAGKGRLTPAEFESTRKALSDYESQPAVVIRFEQVASRLLNSGDVAGALAEYQRLVKLHPKEARHQAEIANALLVGGMGEAARQQIGKAIALEPAYPGAYRIQGFILEHDLLGRRHRDGCDIKGAIAAYRKAKELDPKNAAIRADLARILQYGDHGLPFGLNARMDEAVAEYKSLEEDLHLTGFTSDYLAALAYAGRFATMKEVAAKATQDADRQFGLLTAVAATEGADAALSVARTFDATVRKERLRRTAGTLMALRKYEIALPLLEEASSGSTTPAMRGQLDVLRKSRRYEESELPPDDPKSVVKRVVAIALGYGPKGADIKGDFASDLRPILEKQPKDRRLVWQGARNTMERVSREQGLPLSFYTDVGLSGAQFTQEGSDETGYRVRIRAAAAGGTETYFVVRENGRYLISGHEDMPALTGRSVLRMLDQGNEAAARQWLNWQREEVKAGNADDVLAGSPFTALWQRETQSATPDAVRVAAAALMADPDGADGAVPILVAAREKAGEGMERLHISNALARAYAAQEKFDAMLPVAMDLYAAAPRSETAFVMATQALMHVGKYDEVARLVNERLKLFPADVVATRTAAESAMLKGDHAECDRLFRRIIDELTPTVADYNSVAWNALLAGTNLQSAIEDARRGVPQNGYGPAALLHTLAALYAETGKTVDARDALWSSMDSAGREEPRSEDWYVLGRIAECYGASDAAMSAYRKVEKPKAEVEASTWVLAQRGLKRLEAR